MPDKKVEDIKDMNILIKELSGTVKDLSFKKRDLIAYNDKLKKDNDILIDKEKAIRAGIVSFEEDIVELNRKYKENVAINEARLLDISKEINSSNGILSNLDERLEKLNQEKIELEKSIAYKSDEAQKDARIKLNNVSQRLYIEEEKITQVKIALESLNFEKEDMQKENKVLSEDICNLNNTLDKARAKRDSLIETITKSNNTIDSFKTQINEYNLKVSEITGEIDNKKIELAEIQKEVEVLQVKSESLKKEAKELSEKSAYLNNLETELKVKAKAQSKKNAYLVQRERDLNDAGKKV